MRNKVFDITQLELFNMIGNPEEAIQNSPYLFEDLSQILFKAQKAIKNKSDKPKVPEKKKKEEKKRQVNKVEEQIKELERQNKDLKERLSETSLNPEKKALLERDLEENKKQREAAQVKLDNLQRELKNINDDSNKNNLPIYLGIFAAVVAVICLIILLVRPRRRNQY